MKNVIYKISNNINERIYIGSTHKYNVRYNQHKHHLLKGTHHNRILQSHVKKYGFDSLLFEIIEHCESKDLIKIEQFYIDKLKPYFNIRKVAESMNGTKRTEEQKKYMIKQRMLKSPYKKGWKHSDETKRKISENRNNKPLTEEQKKHISQKLKGRIIPKEVRVKISEKLKGRVFSENHKKSLSNSAKGNKNWENVNYKNSERSRKISEKLKKAVYKYDLNMNLICIYESTTDASLKNNTSKGNISQVINGLRKTAGGFIWKRN